MSRHARLHVALLAALACLPAQAAQRAFVSSAGNDANAPSGCTFTLPCRSFQAAHAAVDPGGEIVALDTAGYGPVTIGKSVSIIGNPGAVPSIAVATGTGVTIATPGIKVVLRNLNINGVGGLEGIAMTTGDALTIESCVVANFTTGIRVDSETGASLRIVQATVRGNGTGLTVRGDVKAAISGSSFSDNIAGVHATRNTPGTTLVAIDDSAATGNSFGFVSGGFGGVVRMSLVRVTAANNSNSGVGNVAGIGGTAIMTVGASMASGNGYGFFNEPAGGTATFRSLGNNVVADNDTDTFGVITPLSGS